MSHAEAQQVQSEKASNQSEVTVTETPTVQLATESKLESETQNNETQNNETQSEESQITETQTQVDTTENPSTTQLESQAETENSQETFESKVENSVTKQQENTDTYIGQVKWFNNRLGYGFITIMTPGEHDQEDIFVHQQHINPQSSDYRSLQQGEYVSFKLGAADGDTDSQGDGYTNQAINVTGVFGGSLLCDQIPRRGTMFTPRNMGRQSYYKSNRPRKFNNPIGNRSQFNDSNETQTDNYNERYNDRSRPQQNNGGWQRVGQRRHYNQYDDI